MKLSFYRTMLWAMRFELSIALSTGRNPAQIKQLREDIAEMESYVDRMEVLQ